MKVRFWILLSAIGITLFGCYLASQMERVQNPWKAYNLHCGLIVTLAIALALWCHAERKPARNTPGTTRPRTWVFLVILAAGMAVFSAAAGMRQFAGFDHSALIDTPWRMLNGQRPYHDFPSTLPVGFYIPAYYAFKLCGASWFSLVLINSLFAALTFLWTAGLLARLIGPGAQTWMLATAAQACTTLLVGYWWYNPVTTVMASVFFLSSVVWMKNPGSRQAWISWGGSLLLFSACKPNIAGPLIVGTTVVLLFNRMLRRRVLWTTVLALAVFTAALAIHHIKLSDMLTGYLSVASRGFSAHQFMQDLDPSEKTLSLIVLALIVLPLFLLPPRSLRPNPVQSLCLIALACGLYGFATNGESKLVDIPLILFSMIIWTWDATNSAPAFTPTRKWAAPVIVIQGILIIMLLVSGIGLGWLRHRVKLAGAYTFFQYGRLLPTANTPFFAGLKAGPIFQGTLAEVSEAMQRHPDANVFFGPRMQWAYAAMNRPSPINQPSWWHPGVAYKAEDDARYLDNWRKARHEVLVFFKDDYTYLSPDLLREIASSYHQEINGSISVFTLKPATDHR